MQMAGSFKGAEFAGAFRYTRRLVPARRGVAHRRRPRERGAGMSGTMEYGFRGEDIGYRELEIELA